MFGSENEQGVVEEQELGSKIEIETVLFQFPHQDNSGKCEQTEANHREGRETGEQVSVGKILWRCNKINAKWTGNINNDPEACYNQRKNA